MPSLPRAYRLTPPARPRTERHTIAEVSYRTERIMCSCGELVTADPDELEHDRHEPLTVAWQEHRRGVGAKVLSVAQAAMNHRRFG